VDVLWKIGRHQAAQGPAYMYARPAVDKQDILIFIGRQDGGFIEKVSKKVKVEYGLVVDGLGLHVGSG
jgi:hypothetical protein